MYVIAQPNGAKRSKLYKVKTNGGRMTGIEPNGEMWTNTPVEIKGRDVILHLGENPPVGSCYGVRIEPACSRFTFKGYGEVICYVPKMTDNVQARWAAAFPDAVRKIQKLGPACDWDLITEIRNPSGIKGGLYKYRPNGTDVLTYYHNEGTAARTITKIVAHEFFHGVWVRYMDAADRSEWIDLYERFISVTDVTTKDIQRMVRDMRQIARVADYLKDAEAEEQAAANIYLKWLNKVHDLSKHDVQDLIESGGKLPIPNTHIHKSAIDTPITLYSKNSAAEMFAEAGSSHVIGDLSDKTMINMLRKLR